MQKLTMSLVLTLALGSTGFGQSDDFAREPNNREAKDPLEGRTPPALQVSDWMNTGGRALTLESLRGKVVILDFWGTW